MNLHPRPAARLPLLLAATLLSVLLRVLLPADWIERLYSRGIFTGLRNLIDYSVAYLPFPLFYLFWTAVAVWIVWAARSTVTDWRSPHRRVWIPFGARLLSACCWLLLSFLWLWGYNYGRPAVEERMQFAVHEPDLDELRERVYTTAEELARWRSQITADTQALAERQLPDNLVERVRPLLAGALREAGYPAAGRPRAWQLYPRGLLLRLSTAGVYWPWAGQGNLDAGLHPLQKPAVLAHELAHAYGFGDEGTCSFWSYLAGQQTDDPALRYALELAYWRHIAGLLRYADPEGYLKWRTTRLDPGIRNDLAAIYANGEQYRDIAPALRDATYTAYLKAQGIHEGLLNYGRVVRLVEGYRKRSLSRRR
jgi:hypothetical protein